jgi:hypothetical protein
MTTLLFGSERGQLDTPPMPIYAPASRVPAGGDQVALGDTELMPASSMAPSVPPPLPPPTPPAAPVVGRPFPALPAMTAGLLSTAAMWLGLALFVIAAAYPLSDVVRAALTLIGTSMMGAVIALALSSRPEYA